MRILVIKLRGIGDCLLSIPAIRALREKYPSGYISVLTEVKCADVFEGNVLINEIIKIPSGSGIFYMCRFISKIRKQKFDLVIDLFCNPRSAIITLLSGAETRVGMDLRLRKYCYNKRVKGASFIKYAVEANLDVVRSIGADTNDKSININISEEDKLFAKNFLDGTIPVFPKERGQSPESGDSPHFFIAINPVASWSTKSWGIKKFAVLADLLIRKYNAIILILWGPGEYSTARSTADLMKNKPLVLPDTKLKQSAAVLNICRLLITNDSAVKHIAVALDIPTITLFGSTNTAAWHPPDNNRHIAIYKDIICRPCDKVKCDNTSFPIECMEEISVEDCMNAITGILGKMGTGSFFIKQANVTTRLSSGTPDPNILL